MMKIRIQRPLLKITRGKTKNPFRPIESDRFLIGAGSCCQLQLSAEEIPMVYAIVHQIQGGYQIEALYNEPRMLVNGSQKQFAILQAGDRLTLGPYEFEYLVEEAEHVLRTRAEESEQKEGSATEPKHAPASSLIPPVPSQIEQMSASELVARIEKELELIDDLEKEEDQKPGFRKSA